MLQNYFIIAFRNLQRAKIYASITIVGLALGIASCLLVLFYAHHELSYDTFHREPEKLFRLSSMLAEERITFNATGEDTAIAREAEVALPTLIGATVRFSKVGAVLMQVARQKFYESHVIVADPSFFHVLNFPLLYGDNNHILSEPQEIVLSERLALKYFGRSNVIGESVSIKNGGHEALLNIVGVMRTMPSNSWIQSDAVLSFQSAAALHVGQRAETIVQVRRNDAASVEQTRQGIEQLQQQKRGANAKGKLQSGLQPLTDVHLHPNGIIVLNHDNELAQQIAILLGIALVVMLVACVNYVNMQTARATLRSKEIGVRKVLGANRYDIMRQFFTESVLFTTISFGLAFCIVELALPAFSTLIEKPLSFSQIFTPTGIGSTIGLYMIIALMCGGYPALYVSSFSPMLVLRRHALQARGNGTLRKMLVVAQFTVSVAFIAVILMIQQQLAFMQSRDLGFDREGVVAITLRGDAQAMSYRTLKNELKKVQGVQSVSATSSRLVQDGITSINIDEKTGKEDIYRICFVDEDFAATMGLCLKEGRWFSRAFADDWNGKNCIISEEHIARYGLHEPVCGQTIPNGSRIVGVIREVYTESLHNKRLPMSISAFSTDSSASKIERSPQYMCVKLSAGNHASMIAGLETRWKRMVPNEPFEFTFLDDDVQALYHKEQVIARLVSIFGALTLSIACMGLFALVMFTIERRTKEIGIRKVLGASVGSIIGLLSTDFLKLVAVAIVIATPLAYWAVGKWLQDFAYRVELSWWVFALAGIVAVAIASATVAGQAWRAARANPVDALRSE